MIPRMVSEYLIDKNEACAILMSACGKRIVVGGYTMELGKDSGRDFFDELGLEVTEGEIEVGGTYPIFGMVTAILHESPGQVVAEINHNIRALILVTDPEKIELLKRRAFESGIFVSTVLSKEPSIQVECRTIIFGRPQSHYV